MAKCKEVVLGIGLVVITSFSWLVSACSQTVTSTISIVVPRQDNSTPVTSSTTTEPPTLTNSTPEESPSTTPPPPTVEPSTPAQSPTTNPSIYNVDINNYSLAVTGTVNTPLSLSYAQIQAFPTVTENLEIICPDTEDEWDEWTGVPVSTLLKQAGLPLGASEVIFTGIDGYHMEFPLEFVLQDGVFLAYQMNGQTLSQDRGYPLRLVVKGGIGADWLRWVTKIEVKPALASFSNSSTIIQKLARNIPTAGSKLCSCLLLSIRGISKSINQKPL